MSRPWYPAPAEYGRGPSIREDADRLAHVVSYDHHRFCDGRPTHGVRDFASFVTCIKCAATASLSLVVRAAYQQW